MPKIITLFSSILLLFFSAYGFGAANDGFLQAKPTDKKFNLQLQAGIDFMNDRFDVFGFGDSLDEPSQYQGGHIQAGLGLGSYVWLEGSYYQRDLEVGNIQADVESWQLASQFLLVNLNAFQLSLRTGAWGNSTDNIQRNYNLLSGSTRTSNVNLQKPQDKQIQLDIIAGIPLTPRSKMNVFLSTGKSDVDFKHISSTGSFGGCEYDLSFTQTGYLGELAKPCNEDLVITRIYTPYTSKDIRPNTELRYDANFYKLGLNTQWENQHWRLSAAYVFSKTERNTLDSILENRGNSSTNNNHVLAAEIAYKIRQSFALTLAGQYLHNQFTGEIPFLYNSISAKYFDHRYGLISVGFLLDL